MLFMFISSFRSVYACVLYSRFSNGKYLCFCINGCNYNVTSHETQKQQTRLDVPEVSILGKQTTYCGCISLL